ncbi:MAG: hypothetical protein MJ228_02815 [Bacilli bacterium]|nr:hypothetical protein [Bacilli bacterium]
MKRKTNKKLNKGVALLALGASLSGLAFVTNITSVAKPIVVYSERMNAPTAPSSFDYTFTGTVSNQPSVTISNGNTVNVKISDYSYTAGTWAGAFDLKGDGTVNFFIYGSNSVTGGNHGAFKNSTSTLTVNIIMTPGSTLVLGSKSETALQSYAITNMTFYDATESSSTIISAAITTRSYTIEGSSTPHTHSYTSTVVAPTCLSDGYTLHTCSCGDSYRDTVVRSNGHTYQTETIEPTCTEEGYDSHVCSSCGASYADNKVDPLGHDFTDVVTDPTCTEEGYTTHTCERCGDVLVDSRLEPSGHDYASVVTDPTCTERGYTTYTCVTCGHSYVDDYVDPLGHDYDAGVYTPHTQSEVGYTTYTCTACSHQRVEEDEDFNHHYVGTYQGPVCDDDAYTTYVCDVCGDSYVDTHQGTAPNHEHTVFINRVNPTTSSDGYEGDILCTDCNKVIGRGEVIPMIVINEESSEEVKEIISENIESILMGGSTSEEGPSEEIVEAIEKIDVEVLADISDTVSEAQKELEELKDTVSEEKYEEMVEILQTVTEKAVVIASHKEEAKEEAAVINELIPEDSGIDMASVVGSFYERVMAEILGKEVPDHRELRRAVGSQNGGIDYDLSVDIYKKADAFVNESVNNMSSAALYLRNCSGERLKGEVNRYITAVSVSSFRDFDKEAADNEFVEAAYTAIMANLQQNVLASLEKTYNENVKSLSGTARSDFEREYNAQKELVTDNESFEVIIFEVMRQKFRTVIANKYKDGIIGDAEYAALMEISSDVDSFEPVYREIFRSYCLNEDNAYGITLQEVSDSAIEKEGTIGRKSAAQMTFTSSDGIVLGIIGTVVLGVAITLIVTSIRRKKVNH